MADTLSNNFCSLCGQPFDRSGSKGDIKKTSLASQVVEESGLLDMLNINVTLLRKDLVFICFSCRNVFSNYTAAKKEAIKLLTEPFADNDRVPFVPYLKRPHLHRNSDVPSKIQKLEDLTDDKPSDGVSSGSQDLNTSSDSSKDLSRESIDEELEFGEPGSKLKSLRSDAMRYLGQGLYRLALRKMWFTSRKFRACLYAFITNMIRRETKNLLSHDTIFTKQLETLDLDEISWEPTISIMSDVAPTTLQVLYALLGINLNTASQELKESKHNLIGALLSMALYKRYRGKATFIPLLHSLYLHNTGTPPKVTRTLHEIGLATPLYKLYEVLGELSKTNKPNDAILQWKKDLSAAVEFVHRKPDSLQKKLLTDRRKKITVIPKPTPVTSYSLCWDAIQYPSHSSKSKKKKVPLPIMAQTYAVKSRVPFMMVFKNTDVRLASNISFEEYVPDSEDFIRVRQQMRIEIKKIIVKHLDIFNDIHVSDEHMYSESMAQKSEVLDLGSPFKFPSDNGSVAALLKNLKQYMAVDGDPVPMCIFGSPSSVEKMVGAKDVMSCFSDKWDRLDDLEPCITDFGRQILIAQDIIKIFYPNGMPQENGNLHDLWAKYKPDLKGESPDYKAITLFLEVIAHGHTIALAKKKLGEVAPLLTNSKLIGNTKTLDRIADEIICDIWPTVDTPSLDVVRQGNEPDKEGECSFGDCVNYHEKARLPCSERCSRPFLFCCKKPLNDGLIECGRRENCPRGGWFHLNKKCCGLSEAPEDDWLCSLCVSNMETESSLEEPDLVWEYHRGLLWYCLFFAVSQSAESQGNGWLLHAVWKVCMPIFESRGHSQYLQQGYSFLSAVAGRIPRLAAHDAVHNRTINLKGGENNNVSWDRAVEIFNQELLRKPPPETISREDPLAASRAMGAWLHQVNSAWEKRICNKPDIKDRDLKNKVEAYVKFVTHLDILQKVPGRSAYKDVKFAHNIFIKKPKEMVEMLQDLCKKDESRQMNERKSDSVE